MRGTCVRLALRTRPSSWALVGPETRYNNGGTELLSKIRYRGTLLTILLVILAGLLFGMFTTLEHVRTLGIPYLQYGNQIKRHQAILSGNAGNPWQYRVFSAYLVESIIKTFKKIGVHHHIAISFILFRFLLDTAIFFISFLYYKRLGLSAIHALIGISILAWGMSYAHYDSDLQFSTYFDVIFYLLAGVCILHGKPIWIIPISAFASLNRETGVLIPLLFLFSFINRETISGGIRKQMSKIAIFGMAFTLYISILIFLRLFYEEQSLLIPYGHHPGLDLLHYNLARSVTWGRLFATLGIIPILAVIGYRKWTSQLKIFFWVIVPIWFIIHIFGAVMAETRLFLVPHAMVFVPGALLFAQQGAAPDHYSARAP